MLPFLSRFLVSCAAVIGFLYLLLALSGWTVWAVLSARMGARFSPLNSLLWTGLMSAIITGGGFLVHHRQLRLPTGGDWWLLAIFCTANTIACFGYYAALRHLPGMLVIPMSHLYLILGPLLLAILERRTLNWQQLAALGLVGGGVLLFLANAPASLPEEAGQPLVTADPGATGSMASAAIELR
jgi:drug/metabolite transporter (DMT)-like permease